MINNQNLAVLSEKVAHLESAVTKSDEASEISYDNTESGLVADDVQGAIDEVVENVANLTDYQLVNATTSITVSASGINHFNPVTEFSEDIPTGYIVLGVIGYSLNSAQFYAVNMSFVDSDWGVAIRNVSTGEITSDITLKLLCIKTRS